MMATTRKKSLQDKIKEINRSIQYLKVCDDFYSDEACRHLDDLFDATQRACDCVDPVGLRNHIGNSGFGLLFPKLWEAFSIFLDEDQWETEGFKRVEKMLTTFGNIADSSPKFGSSLGECGGIGTLFTYLNQIQGKVKEDVECSSPIQCIATAVCRILGNAIRLYPSNLVYYRKSNAVSILKEFRKIDGWEYVSMFVLAYVATDSEKKEFASTKTSIQILTNLFKKAINADDHRVASADAKYNFSAFELLSAINQLAINDDVKNVIADEEAIPSVIKMLQDDFSSEEQRVAANALFNLAFIEHIRLSGSLQGTIPSKY